MLSATERCCAPYDTIAIMRIGVLSLLGLLLVSACTMPSVAAPAVKSAPGTVIVQDDFNSPVSGWDHLKYEEGIMDYYNGGYRMHVDLSDINMWATPKKDVADVRLEVDAGKLDGPDENRIGLICRSDGSNYYFFIISSDGYYGVGLFRGGQTHLIGQDQMLPSTAIHVGMAVNHLRFDCQGPQLTAFVNGLQLAQVQDTTLQHGDIGILTGSFQATGVDIVYDNFVALAP